MDGILLMRCQPSGIRLETPAARRRMRFRITSALLRLDTYKLIPAMWQHKHRAVLQRRFSTMIVQMRLFEAAL
jgi:hypothetical protein